MTHSGCLRDRNTGFGAQTLTFQFFFSCIRTKNAERGKKQKKQRSRSE